MLIIHKNTLNNLVESGVQRLQSTIILWTFTEFTMIKSIRLKENNFVTVDIYISTKKRHQVLRFLQRILKLNV